MGLFDINTLKNLHARSIKRVTEVLKPVWAVKKIQGYKRQMVKKVMDFFVLELFYRRNFLPAVMSFIVHLKDKWTHKYKILDLVDLLKVKQCGLSFTLSQIWLAP